MTDPPTGHRWFTTDADTIRGVVVLVHGLNQHPATWKDMIAALNKWGYHVFRLCLRGHTGQANQEILQVSAEVWLGDFLAGYREVEARYLDLPKLLIAYSLGGLVATVAQGRLGRELFARQVLLAPAIATRPYTRLVLLLAGLVGRVPSDAPEYYRANQEGISVAGYRALFDLEDMLKDEGSHRFPRCPTRIVMRNNDELIHYRGIKRLIRRHRLNSYEILTLPEDGRKRKRSKRNHLIIDKKGLGKFTWRWMLREISLFLGDLREDRLTPSS